MGATSNSSPHKSRTLAGRATKALYVWFLANAPSQKNTLNTSYVANSNETLSYHIDSQNSAQPDNTRAKSATRGSLGDGSNHTARRSDHAAIRCKLLCCSLQGALTVARSKTHSAEVAHAWFALHRV